MKKFLSLFAAALLACTLPLRAADAGRCRSIHLAYDGAAFPAGMMSVMATPEATVPGTFVCLMSFTGGCCGLQELNDGRRILVFNVWDSGEPFNFSAHPEEIGDLSRTKVLANHPDAVISRSGEQGSGAKAVLEYPWEVGKPVRMALTCAPYGDYRTVYTCWLWDGGAEAWVRLAAFATLVAPSKGRFGSCYAYLEDFAADPVHRSRPRTAHFSRLWTRASREAAWTSSDRALFSADSGTRTDFDAGTCESGYWLTTGGGTRNVTARLWTKLPAGDRETLPACLEALLRAEAEAELPPPPKPAAP